MSVLIKGMEMPTSEEKCKFFQPAPFRAPYCVINGVCGGLEDCPLVPVPPHGRLIDADELSSDLRVLADCVWNQNTSTSWANAYEEIDDRVQDAPTIIEAEEGET